ncbi:MAG: hypothetical protein MO853_03960 [Candidatus Protistobacter heckmanni]|nr:hypothetical protein [Candidatus Protistobacter heckmanni]
MPSSSRAQAIRSLGAALARCTPPWARYRLAVTKLPELARRNVAALYGLDAADSLPLALQCDSVDLLGDVALQTDTVIFATYEAIRGALDAGRLVSLAVDFSTSGPLKLAVVHRKGRPPGPPAPENHSADPPGTGLFARNYT